MLIRNVTFLFACEKEKLGIVDQKKKAPSDLFASIKAREFAQTNDLENHVHFKTASGNSKDGKFRKK